MKKSIFKPISAKAATILISLSSLLSYGIGLIRDRVIAVNFGTSSATDAYNASFIIPDFLFNFFIAGALAAAFLPVFNKVLEENKSEAFKLANTVINSGLILIGSLVVVIFIFAEPIINFIFHSFTTEMKINIINMTRLMLPSAILFTISNSLGNILMSYKHFTSYSLSPVFYNLGIIFGVVFLNDQFGIYSAAIGVLIGAILHLAIRIGDLINTDFQYRFQSSIKDQNFIKIIKLMIPRSISLLSWQINIYLIALISVSIAEGGLAAFNFAKNIESFAVSLFGIAFATAIFPFLSTSHNKNNKEEFTMHIQDTAQKILFFTIPAAIGVILLGKPIVEIILSGGIFKEEAIKITSTLLIYFGISIPFESVNQILIRAYFAKHNTITPTIITVIIAAIIPLSAYLTAPKFGIQWITISFSAGLMIQTLLLVGFLKKSLENFQSNKFLTSIGKTIIGTAIMGIFIIIIQNNAPENSKLINAMIILLSGTVYLGVAKISKNEELNGLITIKNKIQKI